MVDLMLICLCNLVYVHESIVMVCFLLGRYSDQYLLTTPTAALIIYNWWFPAASITADNPAVSV